MVSFPCTHYARHLIFLYTDLITMSEVVESEGLLAVIQLPESLFMDSRVVNSSVGSSVGLVFTVYTTPVLFPLANGSDVEFDIRTPVIGALFGGLPSLSNLTDPIAITLQLNITNVNLSKLRGVLQPLILGPQIGNFRTKQILHLIL